MIRIFGVPVEIEVGNFPNTSRKCYCFNKPARYDTHNRTEYFQFFLLIARMGTYRE